MQILRHPSPLHASVRMVVMGLALIQVPLLVNCTLSGRQESGPLTPEMNPASAATLLVSTEKYPAALAVEVTTRSYEVAVRGVRVSAGAEYVSATAAFPMGSMTKAMTATLAAVLVQEGKLTWSSKPSEILPEFSYLMRSDYAAVTLKDLLGHRAGIYAATTPEQIAALPEVSGTATEQRLELSAWMLQQVPETTPLLRTAYSNGGYVLAAAMLERAGGGSYESLLQSKVFSPMGSTVSFGTAGLGSEPMGHAMETPGTWSPVDPSSPEAAFPAFANPAGGAKLNGAAFARFIQMHLRAALGQSGEVLTPASAAVLHSVIQNDSNGYALGWVAGQDLRGNPLRFHAGSDDYSYYGLMAFKRNQDGAAGLVMTGYNDHTVKDANDLLLKMLP